VDRPAAPQSRLDIPALSRPPVGCALLLHRALGGPLVGRLLVGTHPKLRYVQWAALPMFDRRHLGPLDEPNR